MTEATSASERGKVLVEVVEVSRRRPWRSVEAIGITREGQVLGFEPASSRRLRRSVREGALVVYELDPERVTRIFGNLGPTWSMQDVDRLLSTSDR